MTPHLTLSQLEQYLSKAAWILKGPIGASDFKAYIFPMLFFKRISDVYEYLIKHFADPPFSLDGWGADLWANDPHGRNIAGVPPKGNGDMAWVQHMIRSMTPKTGRMAVVLPHGALFRKAAEGRIREALLKKDLLEAVIGLGPNIFYGTQFAACIMVFRSKRPSPI